MKILLVIDQFFRANNGMTISARRFAVKLREHGHEVRVVSTGEVGDTEYLLVKQYIPVFDSLVSSQGMTFAKPDDDVLTEAVGWADIVHFLVPFALSHRGMIIAESMGKPFTAAFHVQPENITSSIYLSNFTHVNGGIYRLFNHYLYKHCTHIHCPSRFIADQLLSHGYTGKLHIISNGIDPDFVYRKLPKPPELEGRFVILSVGRLSVEKRQDVIINAIPKCKYADKITLMLAGQGPMREKYGLLAQKVKADVRFGFYEKQQLLDLIAESDLYVHAADAEIEAMACMEAFAGGLVPVISNSPKSATPQFALTDDSLFEAGNPDALARKIDYWMEHTPRRQLTEHEYAESAQKYNLDDCVYKIEDMFREAISEKCTNK